MKKIVPIIFLFAIFFVGCNSESSNSENDIYYIDYYKERAEKIFVDGGSYMIHSLSYNFMNDKLEKVKENYLITINDKSGDSIDINYSWGYRYKIEGSFNENVIDDTIFNLEKVISKERYYEPFSLDLKTHREDSTYLIQKLQEDRYLAYNELEFQVYYKDLQDNLDLYLEKNESVTLVFNFEENGTIFLERVEE